MASEITKDETTRAQGFRVGRLETQRDIIRSNGFSKPSRFAQDVAAVIEKFRFGASPTYGFALGGKRFRVAADLLQGHTPVCQGVDTWFVSPPKYKALTQTRHSSFLPARRRSTA